MAKKYQALALALFIAGIVALTFMEGGDKRTVKGGMPLQEGAPAPVFELKDTSGKIWRLADLRGKVVLVNFWATWCPSCKAEMPSINNLNVIASGVENFQILTILYQDKAEIAEAYFKENGYAMPILMDNPRGDTAYMYGLTGVPETFVIDKKGVLRFKQIGPRHFDEPDILQFLNSLIEEPA